jgi:hypothetical protein
VADGKPGDSPPPSDGWSPPGDGTIVADGPGGGGGDGYGGGGDGGNFGADS